MPKITEVTDKIAANIPTSKCSGLRLFPFLFTMFEMNERSKMCDGALELLIRQEFADWKEVIDSIENCPINRIGIWRNLYNRGTIYAKPTYYSFRYDAQGNAINARASSRLTPEQQRGYVLAKQIPDPRFAE